MKTTAYRWDGIPTSRWAIWCCALILVIGVAIGVVYGTRRQETSGATSPAPVRQESDGGVNNQDDSAVRKAQALQDTADLETLATQIALAPHPRYALRGAGYIKGKVALIEKTMKGSTYMSYDLPTELKAERPQDLGTVIFLEWSSERAGKYDDGEPGYVYLCTVLVIDKSITAIVGKKRFRGGDPPAYKTSYGPAYGTLPSSEIHTYIDGLPRK